MYRKSGKPIAALLNSTIVSTRFIFYFTINFALFNTAQMTFARV